MNDKLIQKRLRFTASVMGNPEYLDAVKDVKHKDRRREGIERLNTFHASEHEKSITKDLSPWSPSK